MLPKHLPTTTFGEHVKMILKKNVSGKPIACSRKLGPFQEHLLTVPKCWSLFRNTCSLLPKIGSFSGMHVPCSRTLKYFQEHVFLFLFLNVFQELGNVLPKFWGTCNPGAIDPLINFNSFIKLKLHKHELVSQKIKTNVDPLVKLDVIIEIEMQCFLLMS